jgi:hypothetical protein
MGLVGRKFNRRLLPFVGVGVSLLMLGVLVVVASERESVARRLSDQAEAIDGVGRDKAKLESDLATVEAALRSYQERDEYKINRELEGELAEIRKTYALSTQVYDGLVELRELGGKPGVLDEEYADAVWILSRREYATASGRLNELRGKVEDEKAKLAAAAEPKVEPEAPTNNNPPGNGYSRRRVNTDVGQFTVDLIAADLGSTRAVVATASPGDCHDNCPVKSLGEYVAENGAYAGVNGSYFCPASYASCAGKSNSFDTLAMNRNKVYFNSDNNVYSSVPAVIFGDGWVRFVGQSLEWGRDTGVDGVLANQPLLVSGSQVVFGGDGDPKKGVASGRSFVASRGSTVYIGVVFKATVAEAARVMAALGMEYALNLDSGGSTALWFGGYRAGPGRNIPNAILLVRK